MENKQLGFDSILSELKKNSKESVKGNYTFKELSLKQQRKILNGQFDSVEVPAKISNIYTEYISELVVKNDDMVDAVKIITLETKPFFVNELRAITLGRKYWKNGKEYELYEVTPDDLIPKAQPKTITFNNFKATLRVPTLYEDNRYNTLLINALAPYKKKKNLSDVNFGSVTDLYQMYELIKYIESFEFNGVVYIFNNYNIQDRIKFLDNLPQVTVNEIKEYIISNVKNNEEKALACESTTTGEKITADINTLFFSSTVKKEDSVDDEDDEETED